MARLSSTPKLFEATYQRGLTNMLTGYGGVQASDHYAAVLGGIALGTPIGALSLDYTGTHTRLPTGNLTGSGLRASYSKVFERTGSNLSLAAYRYASRGFLGMAEAVRTIDAAERGLPSDSVARPRNRLSLSLSQPLRQGWGQLYASGFIQNYWNGQRKDTQFQLGYSNQYRWLSYSINVARMRDPLRGIDNQVMLSLSFPLGGFERAPRVMTNLTHDSTTGTAVQTMLSGTAGENNQFSYGASVSHGPGGQGTSGTVNGQYTGSKATVMGGYGVGPGYNNFSAGLSGSVVVHPGGVTLSPYSSDTVAVVAAAPEAAGARVMSYPGITLDSRGYAVLPYLMPYRINEVAIDPNGISPDVELKTTSQQVAPRAGAIVMLHYATVAGRAVLIDASLPGGRALPFGADVVDGEGNVVGSVGQAGRIYARLSALDARLSIRWGQAHNQQCSMYVALPPASKPADPDAGIERVRLACVPDAAPERGNASTGSVK
jgi:outer membrane usher protein